MQFAGLKNTPKQKKTDTLITLINQSQEIRPQGLDLGRSTSIRGCTSAQIKTLRPYFSIFSITVVRICLRKQQSKFFTNMLSTPSIEPANIWFDSASPWAQSTLNFDICQIHSTQWFYCLQFYGILYELCRVQGVNSLGSHFAGLCRGNIIFQQE